jgi:hypothetical protein
VICPCFKLSEVEEIQGESCLFLVLKQNKSPALDASQALKIVTNRLTNQKVMAPQNSGCQKIENVRTHGSLFSNTKTTLGGCSVAFRILR